MTKNHYLKIHFAPRTTCIAVEISEYQFIELRNAIGEHQGDVTVEVSSHHKISTKVTKP